MNPSDRDTKLAECCHFDPTRRMLQKVRVLMSRLHPHQPSPQARRFLRRLTRVETYLIRRLGR